jgi:nicotinamide phosphoribosyltransferase
MDYLQPFRIETAADSYKVAHDRMDKPGTTWKQYHLIPRGGPYPEIVFYGLQRLVKRLAATRVTSASIDAAESFCNGHLGPGAFNREKWETIADDLDGRLPLRIVARPEGSIVPPGTPLLTVENTHPAAHWLPGHIETLLTRNLWKPTTVATRARKLQRLLRNYRVATGGPAEAPFGLHDFGGRSYCGDDDAGLSGSALLVYSMGTDTMDAVEYVRQVYGDFPTAFSVFASEHSTRGTFGGPEAEEDYIEHMLRTVPNGIVSIVGDTFDIYRFTELLTTKFLDQVKARGAITAPDGSVIQPGKVVVRPDSGKIDDVIVSVSEAIFANAGYTTNAKGYRVFPPYIGGIYGDGINEDSLEPILQTLATNGIATENWVFGAGSGLMQLGLTRDTLKFAYKGNAAVVNGSPVDVFKEPVTDPGKRSIRGPINLVGDGGIVVFEDGKVHHEATFADVRRRAAL